MLSCSFSSCNSKWKRDFSHFKVKFLHKYNIFLIVPLSCLLNSLVNITMRIFTSNDGWYQKHKMIIHPTSVHPTYILFSVHTVYYHYKSARQFTCLIPVNFSTTFSLPSYCKCTVYSRESNHNSLKKIYIPALYIQLSVYLIVRLPEIM